MESVWSVFFLDFSKAFDTIDHDILLMKMKSYGIIDTAYDWFKSYLCDRVTYNVTYNVAYNSMQSNKSAITCGVPQESILGPLLFMLYMTCHQYRSHVFLFYLQMMQMCSLKGNLSTTISACGVYWGYYNEAADSATLCNSTVQPYVGTPYHKQWFSEARKGNSWAKLRKWRAKKAAVCIRAVNEASWKETKTLSQDVVVPEAHNDDVAMYRSDLSDPMPAQS